MEENEISILLKAVDQSKATLDQAVKQIDAISDANARAAKSHSAVTSAMAGVSKAGEIITTTFKGLASAVSLAFEAFRKVREAIFGIIEVAAKVIVPLGALVSIFEAFKELKSAVGAAAGLEAIELRLKLLSGSAETAKRELEELRGFDDLFPIGQLEKAHQSFVQLTKGILDSKKGLQIASDVAVATGQDIESVADRIGMLFDRIRKGQDLPAERSRGIISAGDFQQLERLKTAGATVGQQMDFVIGRLQRFQGAADEQRKTFQGLMGGLKHIGEDIKIQFAEPLLDVLKPAIKSVNEELHKLFDSGRVKEFGTTFAAVISLLLDSIKTGNLGEIFSLSIQAGLEQGAKFIHSTLDKIFRLFFNERFLDILRVAVVAGSEILLRLAQVPADFLSASLTVVLSKFEAGFNAVVNAIGHLLEGLINFLGEKLLAVLNKAVGAANKITSFFGGGGDTFAPLEFQKVKFKEGTATPIDFATALTTAHEESNRVIKSVVQSLDDEVRSLQAANKESQKFNQNAEDGESATDKLIKKIDDQKKKLEGLKNITAGGAGRGGESPLVDESTFGFQLGKNFDTFVGSLSDRARQASNLIQGTLGASINGLSQGISGLITGTATWGQVFTQVGTTIITTLVQIGVEMLAAAALRKIIGATMKTDAATEGATIMASYTPGAVAAGAATFGVGTAIGVTLTIAAILAGIAALAGAFAEGGIIPGAPSNTDNRLALVATGEGIIPASVTSRMGPAMFEFIRSGDILHAMGKDAGPYQPPSYGSRYATGGIVGNAQAPGDEKITLNLAMFGAQQDAEKYLKTVRGRKFLIDLFNGIGMQVGVKKG